MQAEVRRLQDIHAFALAPGSDEILMAHPFSAVPTPSLVRSDGRAFWANCAWDALAILGMLGAAASIDARCAECGDEIRMAFNAGRFELPPSAVIHFAVPPRRFWENVVFTEPPSTRSGRKRMSIAGVTQPTSRAATRCQSRYVGRSAACGTRIG